MAMYSPSTLTPLMRLDRAVPPNFDSSCRAWEARSFREVPAAPK